MNTKIYVFTATGNGLKIANDIAKNLEDCEIISIGKLVQQNEWSIEGDRVGFIFPCFYGTAPKLITEFVEKASVVNAQYFFAVASAGGDIGYSLKALDESLKTKNQKLDYGKGVTVASNYMSGWYYTSILPSDQKLDKILLENEELCVDIANDIKSKVKSGYKASYMGLLISKILSEKRYIYDTRPLDREYSISSSCDGCGICAKVCPVSNIKIVDSKPEFLHNCQRCMACIQLCPNSSFSINGRAMDKRKYKNPNVTLKQLIDFNN